MQKNSNGIIQLITAFLPIVILVSLTGCVSSPLMKAARVGDVATVKRLIEQGVDVNKKGGDMGQPALMDAIRYYGYSKKKKKPEIVKMLLDAGANPNVGDSYSTFVHGGWRAFPNAGRGGHAGVVKLLIDAGADIDQKDAYGRTALMYAQKKAELEPGQGHQEVIDLIEKTKRQSRKKEVMRVKAQKKEARMAELESELKAKMPKIRGAEKAGDDARRAGDSAKALSHYVAAIKDAPISTELGFRLRKKVLKYALTLKPKPSIPREAERHVNRGRAFLKRAKSAAECHSAVVEFEAAVGLAPWSPRNYFNLGLVQEKAEDYGGAIRSFKLYLVGSPDAPDAGKVRQKLDELEVAQELAER